MSGSYLGYPRVNFAGQFRADVSTANNRRCFYLPKDKKRQNITINWGSTGTNEFHFYNSHVTSVVYENGVESTFDKLVSHNIIGNLRKPLAKVTDLDVDNMARTMVHGMEFGVGWDNDTPALYGKWTPSVIAQDAWIRLKCYDYYHHGNQQFQLSFPVASQSTTFITDIQWNNSGHSLALQQLQDAVGSDGKLSVRVTLFYYRRNNPHFTEVNGTLGYVLGTVGVASPLDTLNFGGPRIVHPTNSLPEGMSFPENDLCFRKDLAANKPWMYRAPFEIDTTLKVLNMDFSNALPVDIENRLYDTGILRLGILIHSGSAQCVQLIGEDIPYLSKGFLTKFGGIFTASLSTIDILFLKHSKLVVVQLLPWSSGMKFTTICGHHFYLIHWLRANILLEETPFFIRPWHHYVDRLEYGDDPSVQTLFVTHFGQPASHVQIKLDQFRYVIPQNGIQPDSWSKPTDENGMVTFEFSVASNIPYPRRYTTPKCTRNLKTVPIDGQVYEFQYCVDTGLPCERRNDELYFPAISFVAYSTVSYTHPYAWKEDVEPIFSKYALIAPVMKAILDLSSYEDVTLPRNIYLLNLSLRAEFEDQGYMPTTRDLSPTKRAMILEWLANPIFTKTGPSVPSTANTLCEFPAVVTDSTAQFDPPRCQFEISYENVAENGDVYFSGLFMPVNPLSFAIGTRALPKRPLFGVKKLRDLARTFASVNHYAAYEQHRQCSRQTLQKQLQTAVQLEFATIPLYTTSLYSIVDGCNVELYRRIRSVVVQEMLHMTQTANILIAIGATPLIDDASAVPSYPTYLPGHVLPGLLVSLKKLSLEHIYKVFMGIEVPKLTEVDGHIDNPDLYTIGAFYDEIVECMDILNEKGIDIYDPDTVINQVQWPWNATSEIGTVHIIRDHSSAVNAVREVITQGEGASVVNPYDIATNSLAHFFKFEEVVCQNTIIGHNGSYSYSGESLPFNPKGVWPMRDNPGREDIFPHSNCYTELKEFHEAYRRLLRTLQGTFSGKPAGMGVAVKVMEGLQIHAKRLMRMKHQSDSVTTCGPVWDYHWPEDGGSRH